MRINVYFAIAVFVSAHLFAQTQSEVEYYAILIDGKKLGHAVQTRVVEADKVTTSVQTFFDLTRAGTAISVNTTETSIETPDGKAISFEYLQDTNGMKQKAQGQIKDGTLDTSVEMTGMRLTKTFPWPDDALMLEGMRLIQVKKGLAPGTAYNAKLFSGSLVPSAMAGGQTVDQFILNSAVTVGPAEQIDLFGRVLELPKVVVSMEMGGQPFTATSYVDSECRALKTIVPLMGMTLEMIACDKQFALSENDLVDFLGKMLVQSPSEIKDAAMLESAIYNIEPVGEKNLNFPQTDYQTVEQKDGKYIITVKTVSPPENTSFPYAGSDAEILKALEPTSYIQSRDAKIIDMARHAVGETKDASVAVKQIESFVAGYITEKDLSVGYASASEVAQSRQGDCTEHAILTTALCRAEGIPAKVAFGMIYIDEYFSQKHVFAGHAWTAAYVGGKWVPLDAARTPVGFTPAYITLAVGNGDPVDFFSMINTLGYFKISNVTTNPKPAQ